MLPSEIPRLATEPLVRLFPGVWNLLFFLIPFPGGISIPTSSVSLFFFYILSYLLLKRMGCPSGCLVSTSIQKLFCGSCSAFRSSSDEFVVEKVVSPSYSSAVLGPPLNYFSFEWDIMWYLRTQITGPDSVQVSLSSISNMAFGTSLNFTFV